MTSPIPESIDRWPKAWSIPAGLVALCIIPVAAGAARLVMLGRAAPVTPENARFFAAPVPVALHILGASAYGLGGAMQFAAPLRRRRSLHRKMGRIVTPAGLTAALTGLWMTLFYARPPGDGAALSGVRLIVGSAMLACLVLGLRAIRRREIDEHAAWMTRAYALGLGAGTQALLHLAWLAAAPPPPEVVHTLLMTAGWAVNAAVAERAIRRRRSRVADAAAQVLQR